MKSSLPELPRIVAVMGPTASGKSALGIHLALEFDGEIINCDSVQVYREIEIATAKVPPAEQQGVPHHLLDFVPPEINYTAGAWAEAAREKIKEINARGRTAFLVGGTGFYLRALRRPLFASPPTDERLRIRLASLRERHGAEHLHRMLRRVDPVAAARLHARDWVRVQRALEVFFQIGERFSEQQTKSVAHEMKRDELDDRIDALRLFALHPPRAELYERINRRAEGHFTAGLVDEVQTLLKRGVPADSNALGAHGYRRAVEYLCGARSLASAIEQTKLDVRHYAKRQLTWLRREPGVEWVEGFGDDRDVQAQVAVKLKDELLLTK